MKNHLTKLLQIRLKTLCPWAFIALMSINLSAHAQIDSLIFTQKAEVCNTAIVGECIIDYGQSFIGSPYVAHALEGNPTEKLVINLRDLDCATFVENILAMAITTRSANNTFTHFKQVLQKLRYHAGIIEGYCSRVHYFSDWLFENEQNGFLRDMTATLGGIPFETKVNFMTTHPKSYSALSDAKELEQVKKVEEKMNTRKLSYIPKDKITTIEDKLQNGDIVGITTSVAGLDISHEGFVLKKNGRAYLLHASSEQKKVMVSEEPLSEYLAKHKTQTGIMVARPN